MSLNWFKSLFKKKETKVADVSRIDIPRAGVERVEVEKTGYSRVAFRVRYDDTGEVTTIGPTFDMDALDQLFDSDRPVTILGFAD